MPGLESGYEHELELAAPGRHQHTSTANPLASRWILNIYDKELSIDVLCVADAATKRRS
jgi:hypothetical protein